MAVRRNVIFRSDAFNTTEARPYFINPECFGDDVARWLMRELAARGAHVAAEPGQEDFGWYFTFRAGGTDHDFVLGYRAGADGEPGDWMGTIERNAGLLPSLLGARDRGVRPEAARAIHGVLAASAQISDIRWFADQEYRSETGGAPDPAAD